MVFTALFYPMEAELRRDVACDWRDELAVSAPFGFRTRTREPLIEFSRRPHEAL